MCAKHSSSKTLQNQSLFTAHSNTQTLNLLLSLTLRYFPQQRITEVSRQRRGSEMRGDSALRKVLSGGQPKGKILRQESERGERGWNHVSFISPGEKESINSFNPVFLQIRSALFGTSVAQLSCASGYSASLWDTETGEREQMIISLKEAVMI